ncbi:MAG: hypothetical protein GY705_30985 [Bacteroidetes bacterium]|nr:hypothetical protein [Bacteroidota bacterium]
MLLIQKCGVKKMRSWEVKRNKCRLFLDLCAITAKTEEKSWEFLWEAAINDMKVIIPIRKNDNSIPGRNSLHILRCNVIETTKLFTAKEEFWLKIVPQEKLYAIKNNEDCLGDRVHSPRTVGSVQYIAGPCNLLRPQDIEGHSVIAECGYDHLSQLFFDAIEEFSFQKNCGYFEIPFRACEWCDRPFLGNRFDQRFCNRDHSQRWHAKNSYEKAKASAKGMTKAIKKK